MTMRRPAAFMVSRSVTVSGRGSAFMRLDFRQLPQPEVAVRQLGMRNDKVLIGHLAITEAHDVEIEGAGAPTLTAAPSLLVLDCLKCPEEIPRLERCLQQHHLIEIGRLVYSTERSGFLHSGGRQQ